MTKSTIFGVLWSVATLGAVACGDDTGDGSGGAPGSGGAGASGPSSASGSTSGPSSSGTSSASGPGSTSGPTSGPSTVTTSTAGGDGGGDGGAGGEGTIVTNPGGLQTEHGGMELGEWLELYATWFFGGDRPGREQDRVFLPLPEGVLDPETGFLVGSLDVSLAAEDGFVLPFRMWRGDAYEDGTEDDPDTYGPTEEQLLGTELTLTLDGELLLHFEVDDLAPYHFPIIHFDEPILYDETTPWGAIGVAWVKGLGTLHQPLPPGEHVLHLVEWIPESFKGFDNTWTITVE